MTTTPQHCPGFERFKKLSSLICKCPNCGKEREIFSDELEKNIFARVAIKKLILPNAARKQVLDTFAGVAMVMYLYLRPVTEQYDGLT